MLLKVSTEYKQARLILPIIICCFIVMGTISAVFSYFAFLLCIYVMLFHSEERALELLLMVVSFANVFKATAGGQSFFTYLLLVYVFKQLIQSKKIPYVVVYIFIYALYILIIQLFNYSLNVTRYIKFILNLLFIVFAYEKIKEIEIKNIFLSYILGVVLASVAKISGLFPRIDLYVAEKSQNFFGNQLIRFSGLYSDPNYYSINLIISLILLTILYHRKEINGLIAIILSLMLVEFAGMTGSKSALVMLVFPVFILLYSNFRMRRYFIQFLCLLFGILLVFSLLEGRIDAFDNTIARLSTATDMSSLTTGRSTIWQAYIQYFSDNIISVIFGHGLGANLLNDHAAHNTYIDFIYYLGILGSLMYLLILSRIFHLTTNYQSCNKKNIINFSILICVIVMYFFLSQLFYFDLPVHILLALVVLNIDMTKIQEAHFEQIAEVYQPNTI